MPIDQSSLDGGTPRTEDGRAYPAHLRAYECYDSQLLPLVEGRELTFDELVAQVPDRRVQSSVARWLASAQWRGLVERHGPGAGRPRTYSLTDRGGRMLPQLAA